MKLPKFLTRSKPESSAPAPESELCGMMREAIDATAAGSSPWHLKETREVIDMSPFTREEQIVLREHLDAAIREVMRDILKRKLTEVLTGATVLRPGTILNDVKRMGEPYTEPMKNKTNPAPSAGFIDSYMKQRILEEEMKKWEAQCDNLRNNYAAQSSSMQQMQNAQSSYDIPYEKRKL